MPCNATRMRRDPDLIRALLLAVEAADGELLHQPAVRGYDRRTVHFHVRLLLEAGYLSTALPDRSIRQDWILLRLSWSGYDFLDRVRDGEVWRGTKQVAAKLGSWSLETLGTIAREIVLTKARTLGISFVV
jgi:hypothetical protein